MKRMAALLAVMGALSAMVPATAPATEGDEGSPWYCVDLPMLRYC